MTAFTSLFSTLFISCGFTVLFTIPMIILCKKLNLVSFTDFRRKNEPVPLVGGLCIFFGALLTSFIQGINLDMFLFALPILLIGLLDDRLELGAKPKFTAQLSAVGLWLYFLPPGKLILETAGVSHEWAMVLTGFWLIGLINSMNMIDGMDGAATGFSAIAATAVFTLAPQSPHATMLWSLIGACLGFLWFNLPKAKGYLGDTGSLTLGFLLGSIAATSPMPLPHDAWLATLFVFAFPLMDAVLSMLRRWTRRSNLLKGDRDHIHHKLQKIGFTVPQSLLIIYFTAIYCGMAAVLIDSSKPEHFYLQLLVLLTAPLTLLGAVMFLEQRLAKQMSFLTKSLLMTHLEIAEATLPAEPYVYGVAVDLVTYYKELQNRGFIEVNTFITDFAEIIKGLDTPNKCHLFGAYTIMMVFTEASTYASARTELITEFNALLNHHGVLKSLDPIPLGIRFYSPDSPSYREFLKLYKVKDEPVPIARAG